MSIKGMAIIQPMTADGHMHTSRGGFVALHPYLLSTLSLQHRSGLDLGTESGKTRQL